MPMVDSNDDKVEQITILLARSFVVLRLRNLLLNSSRILSQLSPENRYHNGTLASPQSALLVLVFNACLIKILFASKPWVEFYEELKTREIKFLASIGFDKSQYEAIKHYYKAYFFPDFSNDEFYEISDLEERVALSFQELCSIGKDHHTLDPRERREFQYYIGVDVFCALQQTANKIAELLTTGVEISIGDIAGYYQQFVVGLLSLQALLFDGDLDRQFKEYVQQIKSLLVDPTSFPKILRLLDGAHSQSVFQIKEIFQYNLFKLALGNLENEILAAVEVVRSGIRENRYAK